MTSLVADLRFRGLIADVTDEALLQRLDHEPLTLYAGFDPTAESLQLGNLLQLCTLRRFQLAGHRPISLAGGGTGLIGDPGGKTGERPLVTVEQLQANLEGIRPQLAQFLDFDESAGTSRALLLDNHVWLGSIGLLEFLRDVGKYFTVNQMVAKESVKARLERPEQGISYTEFSYMLLQAYDFLRLFEDHDCRVQLGGSDQWGNITMGVELVRKVRRAEVYGITTPLVTKADGTKFGKSEAGSEDLWLDAEKTSPWRIYQFLLNTEDAVVGTYLRYFSFASHDEIVALDEATASRPERREAQQALAREVCALLHGTQAADRAERAAKALFAGELASLDEATLADVVADAPSSRLARDRLAQGLPIVDALVESGLVKSKSEARTMLRQGGVYVNDQQEKDEQRMLGAGDLLHDRYLVLRRGPRTYHVFVCG